MRRVDRPVQVQLRNSHPVRIRWNERTLTVRDLLECWVHQTGWWKPGGGERRVYYRLATDVGIVEVYRIGEGAWRLARMAD